MWMNKNKVKLLRLSAVVSLLAAIGFGIMAFLRPHFSGGLGILFVVMLLVSLRCAYLAGNEDL